MWQAAGSGGNGYVSGAPGARPPPGFSMTGGTDRADLALASSLQHQLKPTPVWLSFASRANADALQDQLRHRVYLQSGGRLVVGRQSETELAAVMRAMYLTYSDNVAPGGCPAAVAQQVAALNEHVLSYCVPRVISGAEAQLAYLRNISALPVPLAQPQLATRKGERQLIMSPGL